MVIEDVFYINKKKILVLCYIADTNERKLQIEDPIN